jgi:hypothetical protein
VFRDSVHGKGIWVDTVWTKERCTIWKAAVRIQVGYETQHSKIGRCSDQAVVDCSIDESLPCWSDSRSRRYRMRLALHVILGWTKRTVSSVVA